VGQITIKLEGSFGSEEIQYTATEGGHAYAIVRAIHWLIARSPKAIVLDHQLHDKGDRPPESDFGVGKRHSPEI
jgi:hypothetical protein